MSIDKRLQITLFGDSIGKGITTESGRPVIMKNSAVSLTEEAFGLSIDNRSVFGQSLKRLMERKQIERYLSTLDTSKRNVAVLELGGNDADFDWRKVAQAPNEFHDSHTSVKEFSRHYKEAVELLVRSKVSVVVCTIVPIDSKRFFDNVIGMVADKEKVLEFFHGDFNTIHRHQEAFNNEILKIAYSHGLPLIDLREKFLKSNDFDDLMCLDGIHPNQSGQREIFNAVNEFIYEREQIKQTQIKRTGF